MSSERGDGASEQLWLHAGFLRELARGLVRDAASAEDLVQETFAAALEKPPEPGSLRAWLATTLRHRASNERRGGRRRSEREERAARSEEVEPASLALERLELAQRLAAVVLALREPYRTVLYLRYHEGLAPRAIARHLDVPVKTVKTRLARALAELRRELDAAGGGRERWLAAMVGLAFPSALPAGAGLALAPLVGGIALKKLALLSLLALVALTLVWQAAQVASLSPRALGGSPADESALRAPPIVAAEEIEPAPSARVPEVALPALERRVPATGTLVVRVLHERGGEPAGGLCIDVLLLDDPAPRRERRHLPSDALGIARFEDLPAGRARVYAPTGGSAEAEVVANETRELELVLRAELEVLGRVVDPDGLAVVGAEIWVESGGGPEASHRIERSGADGRFVLRALAEQAKVHARAAGFRPSLAFECAELPVGASGARELVLELLPSAGALAGRVRDATGQPIAGARVLAGPPGGWQQDLASGSRAYAPGRALLTTDERGDFAQPGELEPGACELHVSAAGHPVWMGTVELRAGERSFVEVVLESAVRVRGRVVDAQGTPVAGAEVSASRERAVEHFHDPFPVARARSDERGLFELELVPPGEQELVAHVPGRQRLGRARAAISGAPGETIEVELALQLGACIAGKVVDREGRPLVGWSVHGSSQWLVEVRAAALMRGSSLQRVDRTDERGEFLLASLERHPVDITLAAPGEWPHPPRAEQRAVPPGTRDLLLVVEDASVAPARVRGRLLDARGRAPQDVRLTLWDASESAGVFVDFDRVSGAFEHRVPLPGAYSLRVLRGGNALLSSGLHQLEANETLDVGTLLLGEPGRVELELVGPADLEAEGVLVLLSRPDAADERLERAGSLHRSRPLAPGTWRLQVLAETWFAPDQELLVREGETERARVELAPCFPVQLDFELADPAAAWSLVELEIRTASGELVRRGGPWRRDYAQDGRLRIHRLGLPPGHYTAEARTDAGQSGRGSFTITDAASARGPHRFALR